MKQAGLIGHLRRLTPTVRFLVVFVGALATLSIVYPWLSTRFHGITLRLMEATAAIVAMIASPLLDGLILAERTIRTPNIAIEVIEECTGIYEILIFWAAVIAFPAAWRAKITGIIGGALTLLAINIIRMVFLVVVGDRWPDSFDFLHTYFWQATLILMILTVWILWIRLVASRTPKPANA